MVHPCDPDSAPEILMLSRWIAEVEAQAEALRAKMQQEQVRAAGKAAGVDHLVSTSWGTPSNASPKQSHGEAPVVNLGKKYGRTESKDARWIADIEAQVRPHTAKEQYVVLHSRVR